MSEPRFEQLTIDDLDLDRLTDFADYEDDDWGEEDEDEDGPEYCE